MGATRLIAALAALLAGLPFQGCSDSDSDWPPAPRNEEEQTVIDAARRAVTQFDGWTDVAFVVQRRGDQWRVQAWRIVNPTARGKKRCVPWASRAIDLDRNGTVIAYQNHL